jgi:GTPase SAR1 family protein
MNQIKVSFFGALGTGKSAFLKQHLKSEYTKYYIGTMGCARESLTLDTNHGKYILNIWDIPGSEPGCDKDYYYQGTDIAIAFYTNDSDAIDLTNFFIDDFKRQCPDVPIIYVMNKTDLLTEMIPDDRMKIRGDKLLKISVKNNDNCNAPLIDALRIATSCNDLVLV